MIISATLLLKFHDTLKGHDLHVVWKQHGSERRFHIISFSSVLFYLSVCSIFLSLYESPNVVFYDIFKNVMFYHVVVDDGTCFKIFMHGDVIFLWSRAVIIIKWLLNANQACQHSSNRNPCQTINVSVNFYSENNNLVLEYPTCRRRATHSEPEFYFRSRSNRITQYLLRSLITDTIFVVFRSVNIYFTFPLKI